MAFIPLGQELEDQPEVIKAGFTPLAPAPRRRDDLAPGTPAPAAGAAVAPAVGAGPDEGVGTRIWEGVKKALAYGTGALTSAGRAGLEQNPIGMAVSRLIDPKRKAVTMESIASARRPRPPLATGQPIYEPRPPEMSEPSGELIPMGKGEFLPGVASGIREGLKQGLAGYRMIGADIMGDEAGGRGIVRELRDMQAAEQARRGHLGDEPIVNLRGTFGPQSPLRHIIPSRSEAAEAARQAATQLPGIAASVITRRQAPALASMGAEILPREYGQARVEGFDPIDALVSSIGQTAAELIPEVPALRVIMKMPIGAIRQDPRALAAMAKYMSAVAGTELGTEEASTVLGYLVDRGMADPNATPEQLEQDMLATLRQMMVQGPLMAGGAAAIRQGVAGAAGAVEKARIEQRARQVARAIAGDVADAEIVGERARTEPAAPRPAPSPVPGMEIPQLEAEVRQPIEVTPRIVEAANAARERVEQEGRVAQHPGAAALGEAEGPYRYQPTPVAGEDAQAGDRYRAGQGAEVPRTIVAEDDIDDYLEKHGIAIRSATKGRTAELSRLERTLARPKGVGAPVNQRIVLKDKAGELVVGRVTKKDWLKRAQTSLPGEEFARARKWYRKLHERLTPIFDEKTTNVALAWLLSQQQASPSHGMMNVMRAIDRVAGHPGPKAGLNEAALVRALRTGDVEGGMGAKLADFIDSEMGSPTRRIMGGDVRGGEPAAIDVHAFRDVGFVDQTMLRHIADRFGEDAAAQISEDLNLTGEAAYEYGSAFYNDLAKWLNDNNVDGGGWTASQAQAVGWMGMQAALGKQGESVEDIIGKNTRRVSIGLSPGEGSGGEAMSHEQAEKLVQDVAGMVGVRPLQMERGVGAYLGENENSLHVAAFASPETVRAFIASVGYAMRQSSVIAVRPLKSGKQDAIDIISPELANYATAGMLFSAFHQQPGMADLAPGFQQVDYEGRQGIRLLNFSGHWSKSDMAKIETALAAAVEQSGVPIDEVLHFSIQLEEASNDWTARPQGQAYLDQIRELGRPGLAARLERDYGQRAPSAGEEEERARDQRAQRLQVASESARSVFADYESAKRSYYELPSTHGGQILNVDLARELVPEYRQDPSLSPAVHEPASAFIKRLYAEKLAQHTPAGKIAVVVFSGGGPGSGKSTTLSEVFGGELDLGEIFYDATLSSFDSAKTKIDQALAANRGVVIRFVDRAPGEAYEYGVVNRMAGSGTKRLVLMSEHAKTHVEARRAVQQLSEHYADNPMVDILVVKKHDGDGTTPIDTNELGNWDLKDAYRETIQAANRSLAAGRLTREQFDASAEGLPSEYAALTAGAGRVRQEADRVHGEEPAGRVRGGGLEQAAVAGVPGRGPGYGKVTTKAASPSGMGMVSTRVNAQLQKQMPKAVSYGNVQDMHPGHAQRVAGALQDLQDAGMPKFLPESVDTWVTIKGTGCDAMMLTGGTAIGVREDWLTQAYFNDPQALTYVRHIVAHELGHVLDLVKWDGLGSYESFSLKSPRLEEDGDLMQEARAVFKGKETPRGLVELLAYPLHWDNMARASQIKFETFAQMHGLYFTNKGTMRKWLPKWYRLMEDVYGEESDGSAAEQLAEARDRLRQALQVPGAGARRAPSVRAGYGRAGGEARAIAARGPPSAGVALRGGAQPGGAGGGTVAGGVAQRGAPAVGWNVEQPGVFDMIAREMQNKVIDLKRVEQAIEQAGGIIKSDTRPYLTEELYHGRVSSLTKKFEREELRPLFKRMADEGVDADDLGMFLWARHAPEANRQLTKVNPSGATDLSGMSDARAKQVMDDFRNAGKLAKLQALAREIDGITKGTRDLLVREGLLEQSTVNTWEATYKHYVPLYREDQDAPGTGTGFKVRGEESKRRVGSSTRAATDIVAAVVWARERAIIRAEKAKVGRDLIKLAEEFPNPDFWKVDSPPRSNRIDPRTGLVVNSIDPMYFNRPDVFVVKDVDQSGNVRERILAFNENNERAIRLSRAMQNLDVVRLAGMTKVVNKVSRYFANLATQWNPLFWATNFVRDVQTAGVNLQSTPLRGQTGKVFSRIPSSLAGMIDAEFRDGNSRWAQWYREYEQAGGKTGWMDVFDSLRDRQAEIGSMIDAAGRPKKDPRVWAEWSADVIQKTNSIVENAVRLSTYVVAREQGLSERESASIAKNLTVNFNRKGNRSSATNAWFMFFNANVQGTARMMQGLATSRRAWAIVSMMTALGAAMELINRMIGDADRDEAGNNPYELLSDWEKQRNWILMTGGKNKEGKPTYVKMPLPYGMNIFPALGRLVMEGILSASKNKLVIERRSPLELAADMGNVLIDAFAPLGQAGTFNQFIAPTIADPFVQMAENKRFTGTPMVPEKEFAKALPRSQLYFTSTSETAKDLAGWLNRISGGGPLEPGWLDLYPAHIEHAFATMTGGVGTFTLGMTEFGKHLAEKVTGKEPLPMPASRVPFVGKFYGEIDERGIEAKFYRLKEKADPIAARIKALRKSGDSERAEQLEEENLPLVEFAKAAGKTSFKKGRTAFGKELRGTSELPIDERERAKREIREERSRLFQRALEAYNAAAEENR